ncbi:hypothetical protein Pla52n_21540 [Stieleria varia]|uniref:Uncharacterized protein n=1 Tax=Stieleria varia TaxID=2528005 RepID=A0A5C6B2T9_9BACT|nr:hypothetical protein Pla52n_21540 [Stieleria varia]
MTRGINAACKIKIRLIQSAETEVENTPHRNIVRNTGYWTSGFAAIVSFQRRAAPFFA